MILQWKRGQSRQNPTAKNQWTQESRRVFALANRKAVFYNRSIEENGAFRRGEKGRARKDGIEKFL